MSLYTPGDSKRVWAEDSYRPTPKYRTEFRRDLDRLIHSTCFRRLQGKTQLYPGKESDFFRNRLTHSMEVAQIAKTIACKLNHEAKELKSKKDKIDIDIVEFAGLAHDLGHPPFGHQGETILDYLMIKNSGYEGNAQTLRILTQIEKKGFEQADIDIPMYDSGKVRGLNLTARTLASILKYDEIIPDSRELEEYDHPKKAYYSFDKDLVKWIKACVVGANYPGPFKTIECQIMDIADDIAYSTYDLEDGLKAGFYTLLDVVYANKEMREKISAELHGKKKGDPTPMKVGQTLQKLFYSYIQPNKKYKAFLESLVGENSIPLEDRVVNSGQVSTNAQHELSHQYSKSGYARSFLTSSIVNEFIEGIEFKYEASNPSQSKVFFNEDTLLKVEVLKKFTFISQVGSSRLKIAEIRGQEIVDTVFAYIQENDGSMLPEDFKFLYDKVTDPKEKQRVICDFVAGMTDRYAIEFYGRLKSENPETIFKPL